VKSLGDWLLVVGFWKTNCKWELLLIMSAPKVYQLAILGKDLTKAIEKLKTAFSRKKKDINERSVVISTSPGKVTFSVIGAAV
jgi:hypothetical protein